MKVIPYLVFPGTCKKAMEHYATIFNGEITVMTTFGESPMDVPSESEDRIFNSEMKAGNLVIKASDDMPGYEVKIGTSISLYAVFQDKKSKEAAFNKLADEGKILFPLNENFGMLKDKYDVQWMFVNETS